MATELKPFLKEIADAIREKTGSTEPINAQDFATEISNIQAGGSEDRFKKILDTTKSARYLFYNYSGTSVDDLIKYSDTENVTIAANAFEGCINLTSVPLLDTSKVTGMSTMFKNCQSLTTIPLLDTSKVTNMHTMFGNCSKLTSIPLLDTNNVTTMTNMFSGCHSLTIIPLLNTSKVTSMVSIFYGCYTLGKIIIYNSTKVPPLASDSFTKCYHFLGTVNSQYNPEGLKDGRIYVPDDMVESFRTATNWSVFADQILPLSDLPEEEQL